MISNSSIFFKWYDWKSGDGFCCTVYLLAYIDQTPFAHFLRALCELVKSFPYINKALNNSCFVTFTWKRQSITILLNWKFKKKGPINQNFL